VGEWSGRTALVTGASRGIGREVALALAGVTAAITVDGGWSARL
jgi:NAD(P)-dependent dehydrogenase (short-subunit alcohol dehydrogenase family)